VIRRPLALLALLTAAVLTVLALDVLRWEQDLAEQDLRFEAVPEGARYSEPDGILPLGVARGALAGADDLTFREELRSFARLRQGAVVDAIQFEQRRGEVQLDLARLSRVDPDARRRSRAANMIGVLALDAQLIPTVQQDFLLLVRGAIENFRYAVQLDPSNAEAKRNLELALRIPGTANLPPNTPSGSRDVGRTAGLGETGGGY
jgi:hypothetical protein